MICCKKEMKLYIGAVRVCDACKTYKFDEELDKENRRKDGIGIRYGR